MTLSNSKPTFLQKILGKNYKWWYIILFNLKSQRAYFADTLMWTGYTIVSLLGAFFIWWITTKNNQDFDTSQILTYLFVGNLISSFINNWAENDIGWMNKDGRIATKLLSPTPFLVTMYLKFIGRNMLGNFPITVIGFLICIPLTKNYLLPPISGWSFLTTLLFLPLAYSISFLANFSFGCLTFWTTETEGANEFYNYFVSILSGKIIPLSLIFSFIPFLDWQPFAWLLHHPMQIYLGKYDFNQTFLVFAGGIFWCVILYFLAKLVFKMGLKRNESVGL